MGAAPRNRNAARRGEGYWVIGYAVVEWNQASGRPCHVYELHDEPSGAHEEAERLRRETDGVGRHERYAVCAVVRCEEPRAREVKPYARETGAALNQLATGAALATSPHPTFERICELISENRYRFSRETGLQEAIALMLEQEGFTVEREVRLDGRSRIDLVVSRIGIETKVAGSRSELIRQVTRYLASARLDAMIVVSTKSRHWLPAEILAKRVGHVDLTWAGL